MKKTTCILLSLLLVCLVSAAFAAVPSKTTGDLTDLIGVVNDEGTDLSDQGLTVTVETTPVQTQSPKPKAKEPSVADLLLKDVANFLADTKGAPIQYFGEDALAQATQMMPEGTDLTAMALNEFFAVSIDGYDAAFGNVTAKFTFASAYEPGQGMLAMVGFPGADQVTWYPMQAVCDEDGVVAIRLTGDVLAQSPQGEAIIAILSEQAA